MGIMRWDPFRELSHWREEMMERFLEPLRYLRMSAQEVFGPRIDMYQTDSEVVVAAEIPGIENKDDIEISVSEDSIMLRGEIKRGTDIRNENYFRTERYYGTFSRVIPLPVEVEAEKARASYRNGILEIRVPKAADQRRKTVRVDIH